MDNSVEYFEVFPWNVNFETGNKIIDEQHKQLVHLINKLANTLAYDSNTKVAEAFTELAHYADFHFAQEEEIWSEYLRDDNWFSSHQLTHASFLPKVLDIKNSGTEKSENDILEDIVKFLIRWLAFHIIDDDKRLSFVLEEMKNGKDLQEAKVIADKKMNGSIRILIDTVLTMYDGLSTRTINLMRERNGRIKAEHKLMDLIKELEGLSITDQLTEIYNRRHFEETFKKEFKRARRDKKYLSLIICDIDHFKLLNDNYGHLAGDETLKKVANTLKGVCKRPDDFYFRIGGEEFAIITSSEKEDTGKELAEIFRKEIEKAKIPNKKSPVSKYLTISAGVYEKIPEKDAQIEHFMEKADKRLYKAKKEGRNTTK